LKNKKITLIGESVFSSNSADSINNSPFDPDFVLNVQLFFIFELKNHYN
jgi:hypothetical protein